MEGKREAEASSIVEARAEAHEKSKRTRSLRASTCSQVSGEAAEATSEIVV